MFNLMAVVINKQMNKVFIASILTSLNISIVAGNIEINIIAIIKSLRFSCTNGRSPKK